MHPTYQTTTRRRELRQEIRNSLGPSSSEPPSLSSLVFVARKLDELIKLSTDSEVRISVQKLSETEGFAGARELFAPSWQELAEDARDWTPE